MCVCAFQLQTKGESLSAALHEVELKKRQLEENQDALMEEVAKLQAEGQRASCSQIGQSYTALWLADILCVCVCVRSGQLMVNDKEKDHMRLKDAVEMKVTAHRRRVRGRRSEVRDVRSVCSICRER